MKLYNLFEEIILESLHYAKLITENASDDQVINAIDGKYNVNILYDDYPNGELNAAPSKRYIQVYVLGDTRSGNRAIRAYQLGGPSKTTTEGGWKIFRLDRIRGWEPTKVKWKRPVSDFSKFIPTFQKDGSGKGTDKSFSRVIHAVTIGQFDPYIRDDSKSRELTDLERTMLKQTPKIQPNKPNKPTEPINKPKNAAQEPKMDKPVNPPVNPPDKPVKQSSYIAGNDAKPNDSNKPNGDTETDSQSIIKDKIKDKIKNKEDGYDDPTTSRPK